MSSQPTNPVLAPILAIMSGDTQACAATEEAERVAADLEYNVDKAGKAHRAQLSNALRLQMQDQTGYYK